MNYNSFHNYGIAKADSRFPPFSSGERQMRGRWEADERQPLGSSEGEVTAEVTSEVTGKVTGEVTGKVTELKAFKWPN